MTARKMLEMGVIRGGYRTGVGDHWRLPSERLREYMAAKDIPIQQLDEELTKLSRE